jgi:hypothetical protein
MFMDVHIHVKSVTYPVTQVCRGLVKSVCVLLPEYNFTHKQDDFIC